MYIESLVFVVFSVMLIGSALAMIVSRNTIYSALFLVACFVASSVLWLLLEAEFLALILIFVYVGAVMTLFLFVVMLLNMDIVSHEKGAFVRYLPVGIVLMLGMLALMMYVISPTHFAVLTSVQHPADYSNIKALGAVLYTQYAYPVEVTSVILLVAIIAAVSLAARHKGNRRSQNIDVQLAATKGDRLQVLKMPSEKFSGASDIGGPEQPARGE
jgi:NADH-quinone oxidoreductase subunit J